jgi:hypothetical protein|nr:MAG TPA: minor structural protein [Caudoviricetes sp.]
MKRKFLEDLGLEKTVIDQIMAENGKDVEAVKTERDAYKTQLDTATETLKGFEGVNVSELQGKITQLTTDLANKDTEFQSKLAEMQFDSTIKDALRSAGARNEKAVMAILDMDSLKKSKNQSTDIAAAIEAAKKENDYLFQAEKPIPRVVSSTSGILQDADDKKTQANEALRSFFGKE